MASAKVYLQIPAFILAVIGFIMIFIALSTPAWQVVYARELRQWVQSGLWLSCQTRPTGMYTCTYTFTQDDFDFYTSAEVVNIRTPAFYPWQRHLLHLMCLCQLCALLSLISFCVSNAESAEKAACIAFNIFIAIACLVGLGCMLAFAVFSHMVEYRFYHVSVSGIYEKHRGYSYYVALFGCLFYLSSLVISIIYTIKTLRKDRWANGGSRETINAYRQPSDQQFPYIAPQSHFSSFSTEDQFAMRALPQVPTNKYRHY